MTLDPKVKKERYIGFQAGSALKLRAMQEADRADESVGALMRRALRQYFKRLDRKRGVAAEA